MRLTMTCLISVLCLTACDKKNTSTPPTPETPTKPAASTTPKATPKAVQKKPKKQKKLAALDIKKLTPIAQTYRKHLAQGRKSVKAGKPAEGLTHFKAALKLDPNNPRALSEMGWAAFKAKQLDVAEKTTKQGVLFARDLSLKGAGYYNLGRIKEAQNKNQEAADFYQRSLNARPNNKTVQARLDTLVKGGAAINEHVVPCDFELLKGSAITSKTVCQAYAKQRGFSEPDSSCTDVSPEHQANINDDISVLLFEVQESLDLFGERHVLAVKNKDVWYTYNIGDAYNPGVSGIQEHIDFAPLEVRQVIAGGPPELILRWHHARVDTDMGVNEVEDTNDSFVGVLSLSSPTPQWLAEVRTKSSMTRELLIEADGKQTGGTPNLPFNTEKGVIVKVTDEGKLKITAKRTKGKDLPTTFAPGTYELATFKQRCIAQ